MRAVRNGRHGRKYGGNIWLKGARSLDRSSDATWDHQVLGTHKPPSSLSIMTHVKEKIQQESTSGAKETGKADDDYDAENDPPANKDRMQVTLTFETRVAMVRMSLRQACGNACPFGLRRLQVTNLWDVSFRIQGTRS